MVQLTQISLNISRKSLLIFGHNLIFIFFVRPPPTVRRVSSVLEIWINRAKQRKVDNKNIWRIFPAVFVGGYRGWCFSMCARWRMQRGSLSHKQVFFGGVATASSELGDDLRYPWWSKPSPGRAPPPSGSWKVREGGVFLACAIEIISGQWNSAYLRSDSPASPQWINRR